VITEQRDSTNNGDIVVALIRSELVTLKRIELKPGQVVLHPADEEQIHGVLKGLLRSDA